MRDYYIPNWQTHGDGHFQEGKGFVDADHIRMLMCTRGEPMTEEEVNKMIKFAANEEGKLFYVSGEQFDVYSL